MRTFKEYLTEATSVKPGDKIRIFNGPLSWKAEVLEVRPDGSIKAVKDLYNGRIHKGGQWEGAYEKLKESAIVNPGDKILVKDGALSWKAEVVEVNPDGSIKALKDLKHDKVYKNGNWEGKYEKLSEDVFNLDSWLKELMTDSKRNYGYVDLDYVMLALSQETNQHYSEADIINRIKKLGYGSILRESTWTDYYDQIVDLDFNPSTGRSKYKNRKDLEAALVKTYKWNVKSPDVKEALDRYFAESAKVVKEDKVYVFVAPYGNTMDVVKGEMQSTGGFKHIDSKFNYNRFPNEKPDATKSKLKSMGFKDSDIVIIQESAKVVKEAKKNGTDISFDNIASGIRIGLMYDGLALNTFSGGNGFNGSWKSKEFDELYSARDIDAINKIAQSIANDIYSAASKFDSEIEKIMKKHGFKK